MLSSDRHTSLVDNCTMPFCKGCGHTHVLQKLDEAIAGLDLAPADLCVVTDIGCIGLADAAFETPHSVHTTHGRSTAFATGLALADSVLATGRMKTVVLIGDGGAMIGLVHLVHAALLNADVTVLLCNNFLFGMTGGQQSCLSPLGFVTPTSPEGNMIPPLDVVSIVKDAHAGFVARHLATDRDLADTIGNAIRHPGFALVEIVELCTEHGTRRNVLSTKALRTAIAEAGQTLGVLKNTGRQDFGAAYTERFPKAGAQAPVDDEITVTHTSDLRAPIGLIVAGSAGERVQSAAYRVCRAAARSGLYSTQRNDNPVTQGSGFSLSELIFSPVEILHAGLDVPDAVIVVSNDGLREVIDQGIWDRLSASSVVLIDESLDAPPTPARVVRDAFRAGKDGSRAASRAIEHYVQMAGLFPSEAFQDPFTKIGAKPTQRATK